MKQRKNIIKIAIDSPAAAGAGTLGKSISKHYNLLYLHTGKIYRMIAYIKINKKKKYNKKFIKKKIKNLNLKKLQNKNLLSDKIATEASLLAKNKNIRKLVHSFQINFAYNPPKKFNGSCLDGRDITYKIIPDADFKFFITANLQNRTLRRTDWSKYKAFTLTWPQQILSKIIFFAKLFCTTCTPESAYAET